MNEQYKDKLYTAIILLGICSLVIGGLLGIGYILGPYKGCGEVTRICMLQADEPYYLDGHAIETVNVNGKLVVLIDGNQYPIYHTEFHELRGKFIVDPIHDIPSSYLTMYLHPVGSKYVSFCRTIYNHTNVNIWLVVECNSECARCAIQCWSPVEEDYYDCRLCTAYNNFIEYTSLKESKIHIL